MRVYNIRDRTTGKLLRKNHWCSIGPVKAYITSRVNSDYNYEIKKGHCDIVIFDVKEIQCIPITSNNDFNKLMYHTIEREKKNE